MNKEKDIKEELAILLLKHLDSNYCHNCSCSTNLFSNELQINELEDRLDTHITENITVELSVIFSLNKLGQIVKTTISKD